MPYFAGYLQGMVGRADQKPGRDAYVRLEQLRPALDEQEAKLAEVMETAVHRRWSIVNRSRHREILAMDDRRWTID